MPPFAGAVDMTAFQRQRASVVATLVKGVSALLDGAGVTTIRGEARFVGRTRVCVELDEESVRYFDFKDVVVATGSRARAAGSLPFDGELVVEPSRALEWDAVPETLLVAGDDYVAVELAVAYARLGSRVTLLAPGERLLPDFDRDLSEAAHRGARAAGVTVTLGGDPAGSPRAARTVVSAGRDANLERLELHAAALPRAGDHIRVDAQMRVDRHVLAIGDVTAGPPLAHRAMMQGRVAGEVLGGRAAAFDSRAIPRACFADPEIGSVGMTEDEAKAAGIDVLVGRFPLGALGRAVAESATAGFAKLVFNRDGGALVGAHLAGPRATELVAEMALALEMGATAEDIALTVHAHPTFAEAGMEAAEVALGRAIHMRHRS